MKNSHPRIYCKSGLSLSVQASAFTYCSPRNDLGPYTAVEVGFPSTTVDALLPYAEDRDTPTETVYGYVPVEIVEKVIADNGGIDLSKSL